MGKTSEIYLGDCIAYMKSMPAESIDLIVTDPPYMMNYKSNFRKTKFPLIANDTTEHGMSLITQFLEESARVLKHDSAIYTFCSWHHVDFFKQQVQKHFKVKNLIVWNKNCHGGGDLHGGYAPKHELCIFAVKGRPLLRCKRQPDVIDCAKVDNNRMIHPTQKPVELIEGFIRAFSDEGAVVFDPFAGSGTTAVACANTNRRFLGCEIDPNYHASAVKRISEHI